MTNTQPIITREEPAPCPPIGPEQLERFTATLLRYQAGRRSTEQRMISAENWWRLRNRAEEAKGGVTPRSGFQSRSGWLHNVITNKHADAMDAYPAPTILPREAGDEAEARLLSGVLPCVLERSSFEAVYSDCAWQKLKFGTGCYKVYWDGTALNGLGDIAIERANPLNLYWEPGITDIQKSRYFFEAELVESEVLREQYPQIPERETGTAFRPGQFRGTPAGENKLTVISVYYHRQGRLHYCKYTGETVLESTENDPLLRIRGLYDHGRYPFVFDPLFPVEGSPCGRGYVDLCRAPQTEIDLLRTALVENAVAGATPRHFLRADGSVNEAEYLDLTRPIVHVEGNLGEDSIRLIPHTPLDGTCISLLRETVEEMRETTGNTETASGNASGSVTAASAIAALQEASGKGSRDAARGSYRAFCKIIELCIELIRQFYDVPRCFRITGEQGADTFVRYGNAGIRPRSQGTIMGVDMGCRLPLFDIKVEAAKKAGFSELSRNELALELYRGGMFNPANAAAAAQCVALMEFPGKNQLLRQLEETKQLQEQGALATLLQGGTI